GFLVEWFEYSAERTQRAGVDRVRVGDGRGVRPQPMNLGVDDERAGVDRVLALHDVAHAVHEDQIVYLNTIEGDAEWVNPEPVGVPRIAYGDVPRDSFAEPVFAEQAQRGGEVLFPLAALGLHGFEDAIGRYRQAGVRVGEKGIGISSLGAG